MKTVNIKDDPELDELVKDHRDWDKDGFMGRDPKHAAEGPYRKVQTTIRLDEGMISKLREMAEENGIDSYQTFLKAEIRKMIMEHDKKKRRREPGME